MNELHRLPPELLKIIFEDLNESSDYWNLFISSKEMLRYTFPLWVGRLRKHFHIPRHEDEELTNIIEEESLPLVDIYNLLRTKYYDVKDLTDNAYRRFVDAGLHNWEPHHIFHTSDHGFGDLVTYEKTWYRGNAESWRNVPMAFLSFYQRHHPVVATINWGEDGLKGRMTNPGMLVLIWMRLVFWEAATGDEYIRAGEPLHDTLWTFMEHPGMVVQDGDFYDQFVWMLGKVFGGREDYGLDTDWRRRTMPSLIAFTALVPDNVFDQQGSLRSLLHLLDSWDRDLELSNASPPGYMALRLRAVASFHINDLD